MEAEQSQNFNERLSQWVASQGFWFQVRYSMAGTGLKGAALFQLLSIGFRLLIFVLLAAAGTWLYLLDRVDRPGFRQSMQDSIQKGLSATESQMGKFVQSQGQMSISRFACKGDNSTFFTTLEARNLRCKMGILDGLVGQWDPGTVAISRLDMELRVGADDAESAKKFGDAIFKQFPRTLVNTFEIADAYLHWGYSDKTQGSIEGSELKILRRDGGVKILLRGGTFSQNWLKKLEIVSMVINCDREGVYFEKAEFKRGVGTVDFSGLTATAGERPELKGKAKIRRLAFEDILPSAFRNFIEGTFSGDFQISGSTNNFDGVGFKGLVSLDGQDIITLRERIHLLKALSVVDYSRNYHRVDFREGSFELKTTGGAMDITKVNLKADELFTLEGSMRVRLPTPEETKESVRKNAKDEAPIFNFEDVGIEDQPGKPNADDFSLRRAALEAKRLKEGKQDEASISLFERMGLSLEMRRLEDQASERLSRMLRYEGSFKITVPHDAFERTPRLAVLYPVDAATNRIPMTVPIEGNLYDVTLQQAKDVYDEGRQ